MRTFAGMFEFRPKLTWHSSPHLPHFFPQKKKKQKQKSNRLQWLFFVLLLRYKDNKKKTTIHSPKHISLVSFYKCINGKVKSKRNQAWNVDLSSNTLVTTTSPPCTDHRRCWVDEQLYSKCISSHLTSLPSCLVFLILILIFF